MLRNYLAAALRNLVRNRLYTAINVIGLTVGFAAALLIAIFVRDEFSYDNYFPDHENIYVLRRVQADGDRYDTTQAEFAQQLKLTFPAIEKIARFSEGSGLGASDTSLSIRHGEVENFENILWADREMLDILRFRPVAGDLADALTNPNSIVLTRAMARKYFSKDDPIGETLEVNRQETFTVTAVIEDLPSNVNRRITFIGAGQSAQSPLALFDAHATPDANLLALIYMRITDGAAAQKIDQALFDFWKTHTDQGSKDGLQLVPINKLHLTKETWPGTTDAPRGSKDTLLAIGAIGLLIIVAASINFVNLMTARAARRAVEVGVRKVTGAARIQLVAQFVGESVLYVLASAALALVLAILLTPALNAFLDRSIALDLLHDQRFAAAIVVFAVGVGALAGLYPSFVLSAFRPAVVLKSGNVQSQASTSVRQALVILQFALLIGLLIATVVIHRNIQFALTEAQRLDTDQVVIVAQSCRGPFAEAVSALPGVRGTACSSSVAVSNVGGVRMQAAGPGGEKKWVLRVPVDPGFFEFYGMKPVVGRVMAADRPAEAPRSIGNAGAVSGGTVVLNRSAVGHLGFSSPSAAIGQSVYLMPNRKDAQPSEVIGVIEDYVNDTINAPIRPAAYYTEDGLDGRGPSIMDEAGKAVRTGILNVRLAGARVPETLQAIDTLWKQHGQSRLIKRYFLSQHIQARYTDITHQGILVAGFTGVAIIIALLGLFGMAAFSAEQRTKEIGIRKAMGATRGDILRLLVWEFCKPVLWANLIAWPVAYYFMRRWLEGFAYHIDMQAWMFVGASVAALAIAVGTVAGHALLVARTRPAAALRYE